MNTRAMRAGSERGAVLVHTALALLALVAFTTFVADFGTMWLARRQAQNSADAAALAGAIALVYDDSPPYDFTSSGPAKDNAFSVSQANLVYGEAPSVVPATDITFPTCPAPFTTSQCIRVDAYRNQTRGNPLPMFFGQLVGLTSQDIQAMAMAALVPGNFTDCMKPWGVTDKWFESDGLPWEETDTFDPAAGDKYVPPTPPDPTAIPPDPGSPGSGFTIADDLGTKLVLKPGNPSDSIQPGWFFPVVLDPTCKGGNCYRDSISGCANTPYGVGDFITVEPGNMIGPTQQGVKALIDQDPNAEWDPLAKNVKLSCCNQSPRIVPLPVFNVNTLIANGRTQVQIVNILGFFVDEMVGNDVVGYLLTQPLDWDASKGTVPDPAAFSKVIMLVR